MSKASKFKVNFLGILCVGIFISLTLFIEPLLALALPNGDQGHSFVSEAVRRVAPSVVRIDTERRVEREISLFFSFYLALPDWRSRNQQ